jgi:hypothetical protein
MDANPYLTPTSDAVASASPSAAEPEATASRQRWSRAEGCVRLIGWALIIDGVVGCGALIHAVLLVMGGAALRPYYPLAVVPLVCPLVCGLLLVRLRPLGRSLYTAINGVNAVAICALTLMPIDAAMGMGMGMVPFLRAALIPLLIIIALWWRTSGTFELSYRSQVVPATAGVTIGPPPLVTLVVTACVLCNLITGVGLVVALVMRQVS